VFNDSFKWGRWASTVIENLESNRSVELRKNPQTEKCKLFLKVKNASNGICLTSSII